MDIESFLKTIYIYLSSKWKIILVGSVIIIGILCIILFLLTVVISYYILKMFKKNVNDNFYNKTYSTNCSKYMNIYGDLPIKNIYLMRQDVSNLTILFLNLITLYNYDKQVEKYIKQHNVKGFLPQHISIIIEVELPNKLRKLLIIEKNNCINITPNFKKNDQQQMMKIKYINKKLTINSLLEVTRKRVPDEIFFNWHIHKNNCQNFTEQILISLGKSKKKYSNFIYQKEFFDTLEISNFKLHVINCIINLYSLLQNMFSL